MSLVSYMSIQANLRKTANKGLISLLNQIQLEELAYKYFCDDEGNYTCPYTGKVISGKDIILEHIIPVYSNGGTVLFNCVPASRKVNGPNEKGARHLIDWWTNSKYWEPNRLKRLVDYMLEGYDLVFKEYTVDEVESSYLDIELDEPEELEDDLTTRETIEETKKLRSQARNNMIHSYSGFVFDCISILENYNVDVEKTRNKLNDLQRKGIFEDIEKYQMYQNKVKELIRKLISDKSTAYLNYSINIDIKRLISSIDKENIEDVISEIESRLDFINRLLSANNVSIVDYFKSLRDIEDINILYKPIESLTKIDKNSFVENIKISTDTKIFIFIEMLNKGNNNILKRSNQEVLDGYPNIKLSTFWNTHKRKIEEQLEKLKNKSEYDMARQIVDAFEMENNLERKLLIYIEMLNEGNKEILRQGNNETLENYPNIKLSTFWNHNKDKIMQKLFEDLKSNLEYEKARQTILNYFKVTSYEELVHLIEERNVKKKISTEISVEEKIKIFIEMLNKGNSEILESKTEEVLEGYPNIKLTRFWDMYKEKIKEVLKILNVNSKYATAIRLIDIHETENNIDKKIRIFIEMLNKGNSEILKQKNQEALEGYPSIKLRTFWSKNQGKIKEILFYELGDNPDYEPARKIVDAFEVENNTSEKIHLFIEMLNKGNYKILKPRNEELLEGYPNILLANFWTHNKEQIKDKLFVKLKDNPEYEPARQTVLTYFKVNSLEELEMKVKFKKKRIKEDKEVKKQLEESIEYLTAPKKIA